MTVGAKPLARAAVLALVSCGGGSPAPPRTSPAPTSTSSTSESASSTTSSKRTADAAVDARCRFDDIDVKNEAKLAHLADLASVCGPREICEIACLRATCDVGRNCAYACGDVAGTARRKGESYEEAFDRAARGFLTGDPNYCAKSRGTGNLFGSGSLQKTYEANPRHSVGYGGSCQLSEERSPITEIALERTACYGNCPIYTVRLHSDGSVDYIGVAFAEQAGRHRGTIPESWFRSLAALALDIGYFELEDSYSCQVTDNPTVYSSVTRNGQRKIIRHYAPGMTGPPRLRAFEEAIDTFVDYVTWDLKKR
ncbi:MAG TPA: DUF6438 domain-containing protein [Polyangiaceae bacterium]